MTEYYPQEQVQTSTLAIVSLVSGIVSWFLLPFIGPIIAVITGHMAKKEIRESLGKLGGDGLATAGLILGYIQLALIVVGICGGLLFFIFMFTITGGNL